jgi:voltage-gated sodium channel
MSGSAHPPGPNTPTTPAAPRPGQSAAAAIVDSSWFQTASISAILVSSILIGVETYLQHPAFFWLQKACVLVFIVELALRWIARDSARAFFKDGWNIFDIIVIVAAFLPASGDWAPIVRTLRVLRVFRLARNIPELRLIVNVLLKSVVSMKYVTLLALMCFYIFAIIGVKLFGTRMPEQFGTLHEAFFTLFRILTGDDWSELRYRMIEGLDAGHMSYWVGTLYFVLWIIIATFVLVNLIVGAIINNYQEVQNAERHRLPGKTTKAQDLDKRIDELLAEVQSLTRERSRLRD